MKIAINPRVGGFRLEDDHILWLVKHKGWKLVSKDEYYELYDRDLDKEFKNNIIGTAINVFSGNREYIISTHHSYTRINPDIIESIETVGFGRNAVVIEIPDDIEYFIDEYDCGVEIIREKHRTWFYSEDN